jgi:molybdopterin/thiamine biosynthesis adenylyltransferase
MTRPYILIGAGGTGSILFPALVRYLENYHRHIDDDFSLTVIDGKEVSPTKLERQLFFGRYAGNPKATALVEQYESDPDVIIAVPRYLSDDNIHGIGEGSVVMIAADNFPVRARIEAHCKTLSQVAVINGGNEMTDGSLQLYVRLGGKDITPPLSQGHPELLEDDKRDPAALTCQQVAELPSGEQTIIANMMSATAMLNALRRLHNWEDAYETDKDVTLPEEVFFDMETFAMRATKRPEAIA